MQEPNAPSVVLDTNATLDWCVFKDPGMLALAIAIEAGTVRWLACGTMRAELARLVAHPRLVKWKPDSEYTLALFDRLAQTCPEPATLPTLRCTDADDQVFIDLAHAQGARWLVTHDRALLALRRRAGALQIITPQKWQAP